MAEAPSQVELAAAFIAPKSSESLVVQKAMKLNTAGDREGSLALLSHKTVPHKEADIRAGLKDRFGARDDATGEKKAPTTGEDKARYNSSLKVAEASRKYLETGDGAALSAELAVFVSQNPFLKEAIQKSIDASVAGRSTEAEVTNMLVTKIMESGGYRDKLYKLYTEKLKPGGEVPGEAEVNTLKDEIARIEDELKGSKHVESVLKARNEVIEANESVKKTKGYDEWARQEDIARTNASTAERNDQEIYNSYKEKEDAIAKDIADLKAKRGHIQGIPVTDDKGKVVRVDPGSRQPLSSDESKDLNRLEAEQDEGRAAKRRLDAVAKATTAQQDILNKNPDLKKAMDTSREKAEEFEKLRQSAPGAEVVEPQKKVELEIQRKAKLRELADATRAYDIAKAAAERDIVSIPQDAAAQHLQEVFAGLTSKYEEASLEAKTADEQVLNGATEKFSNTWKKSKRWGSIGNRQLRHWSTDRKKTEATIDRYLTGGESGFAESMARRVATVDGAGNWKMNEKITIMRDLGMSGAEVDVLIKQLGGDPSLKTNISLDKDKVTSYFRGHSREFATKAVADHLRAGGKFSSSVLRTFTETEAGMDIMSTAIGQSEAAKAMINNFADQDVTRTLDGTRTWMGNNKRKWGSAAVILALLTAGFGGLALSGVKAAAAAGR